MHDNEYTPEAAGMMQYILCVGGKFKVRRAVWKFRVQWITAVRLEYIPLRTEWDFGAPMLTQYSCGIRNRSDLLPPPRRSHATVEGVLLGPN